MILDTFRDKFNELTNAPNAVAKLRDLILQWAIQGKLEDSDPSDEPPSSWLESIWADEADSRVELNEVDKKEPFVLPPHWRWALLAEVAKFSIGKTPPRNDPRYWFPANHSWVSIADMTHYGTIAATKERVSDLAADAIFRNRFAEAGSILMSFKLTIGKVAKASMPCFHNEAIISLKPPEPELLDFLFRFLPVFAALQSRNNAIKGSTLNKGLLETIPVALPPLAEQKRIVAKVDHLMLLCDQLEVLQRERDGKRAALAGAALARFAESPTLANLNFLFHESFTIDPTDLRQAILTLATHGKLVPQDPADEPALELVKRVKYECCKIRTDGQIQTDEARHNEEPEPFALPQTWCWARIGDFVESMANGIYKPSKFDSESGVGCVRMFNIQKGHLDLSRLRRLNLSDVEIEQYRLEPGDLLVNRVNSRELVGKSAVILMNHEPLVFEAMNIRLRLVERKYLPEYLNLVLQTERIRRLFQTGSKQAIGQASVSQPQVANLLVPIPPLFEQRRIVTKAEQLLAMVDQLEEQLAASQVSSAIIMGAFASELITAQD